MAMKKEALTNLISDDLASRNENWTEIDNTFELKADKATTYTKTEVDTSLGLKANKQQESWITPTLLNGWESHDVNSTVQYMKDSLGFVHFRGLIKTGVFGTVGIAMPAGYRPAKTVAFILPTASSFTRGYITTSGSLVPSSIAYATYLSLDQITYRAEA